MVDQDSSDARGNGPGTPRAPRERSAPRRILVGLGLSLATLLTMAAVGELVVRLVDHRERAFEAGLNRTHRRWAALIRSGFFETVDDPVRRYAMRPGAEYELDGWTFRATEHRTRGGPIPTPKPADERRILALGDSFCFGLWCDEDETVVGQLARRANEAEARAGSGITWRAINTGVPGYHSGQQYRALVQDGLALEPDLVVLYFNTNDILADGFFYDPHLRVLYSDPMPFPAEWRRRLWPSHLYGWLKELRQQRLTDVPKPHLSETSPWSHNREHNRSATARALAAIVATCREAQVPLFAIHQPLMSWTGDTRRPDWEILPLVDWAEARFDELEVPHLNLLGWMRGYRDNVDRGPEGTGPEPEFLLEPYFADEQVQAYLAAMARGEAPAEVELPPSPDFHLTADGYAEVARLAHGRLAELGWLP